ncbi:MAG: hypothetical protein HY698_05145 [Deltaproteobacteria bacterium]|nr:hypothetical protein [Deltaproteobacteria bacterium]
MALSVVIFDDVLAARGEEFRIPGLDVSVLGNADDIVAIVQAVDPTIICMDFAMGPGHLTGVEAIQAARGVGYRGRIIAMSSDPVANAQMCAVGASEELPKKAMLRSFLVSLGKAQSG